jgi:hypothetical protein
VFALKLDTASGGYWPVILPVKKEKCQDRTVEAPCGSSGKERDVDSQLGYRKFGVKLDTSIGGYLGGGNKFDTG